MAPESARGGRAGGCRSASVAARPLVVTLLVVFSEVTGALPVDGVVVGGSGAISQAPNTLTVTQASSKLAVNWQGFGIAAGERVNFVQPGRSAIALNRVLGGEASAIYGQLSANGQVFLVNSNGILFGRGAQVNVGGLVASTLDLSVSDFMAGQRTFAGSGGRIDNLGSLSAADGGYIALLGGQISNQGTITANLGTVALAAGNRVSLDFAGDKLLSLQVEQGALDALAENSQLIRADGGSVILTARAAGEVLSGVVNNTGIVRAKGISNENGVIRLSGDLVVNTGTLDASGSVGANGGAIEASGRSVLQAGAIRVDGAAGGSVKLTANGALIQTAAGEISANGSGQAGSIALTGGSAAFLSGSVTANGERGGQISVTAPQLTLAATKLSADGTTDGGTVLVGGDAHGANAAIANAQTTTVNPYTTLSAQGKQGKIVVWSDQETRYYGSATTGAEGFIEVSGKANLIYGGKSSAGVGGQVLLDPTDLVIDASAPAVFYVDLANPGVAASETHGSGGVVELTNGNIAVATPNDNFGASKAGAVYLYDGKSGALISALTGSSANDQVGSRITTLTGNGNFVLGNFYWNNGAATKAGASTWGSGTVGVSGVVSSVNSLVGSTANDMVGVITTALSNGNYVVQSPVWNNGAATEAGAATWGSGTSGVTGVVSNANSLVGSNVDDNVGASVTPLSNGNYVVGSKTWNGTAMNAGAATWGSGTAGISGVVSSANSLVGSMAGDGVGTAIIPLVNGNYVVSSYTWNDLRGAVTWGSGTSGVKGAVSSANSLVGSVTYDQVGGGGITALSNGNYVVRSSRWNAAAGAVTWGSGTSGVSGVITSSNSLVGSQFNNLVGSGGITALSNGNYVVVSPDWDAGSSGNVGAVTWGNGSAGVKGIVSSSNSLVGSTAGEKVGSGGVTALANGNYVVKSPLWARVEGGTTTFRVGSVTWGNGATGTAGIVSSSNSLVGSTMYDEVGSGGVTALANGNYVVASPNWINAGVQYAGAVTWGNGATQGERTVGTVSSINSLVGVMALDRVGYGGITALTNGNYVVSSYTWNNGTPSAAGAATWGNGLGGTVGTISSSNSLVGDKPGDNVGIQVTALANGNYVVRSYNWGNGTLMAAGAATWGNGLVGTVGVVSSSNSLVGSTAYDLVGTGVTALANGNYVVSSPDWNNGTANKAGAMTWGSGTAGVKGVVSSANSLVGSTASDQLGSGGIVALANGNYVVRSPNYDQPGQTDAGAVWLVADPSNLATLVNGAAGSATLSPTALAGAAVSGSTVTLQASHDITVNSAISVAGALNLVAGNDLTLNAGITSTASGDALQLSSQRFINHAGASALTTPNGRWLVWSATPENDTRGGLNYAFKQYGATYGSTTPAQASGNGFLYTVAPVITASLTGSVSKVYDATTTAALSAANYASSGAIDGDNVTLNSPLSGTYDNKNAAVGGKEVTVDGLAITSANNGAATVYGYRLASPSIHGAIGAITAKELTLAPTAANKTYDGNATASVTGYGLTGFVGSETVGASSTAASFSDKNAASGKTVSITGIALSDGANGGLASNYSVASSTTTSADISARPLNVTYGGVNKAYDGTVAASVTTADDRLGGDVLTISRHAAFVDANVGIAKRVNVSGASLSGAAASNYALSSTTGTTSADITAVPPPPLAPTPTQAPTQAQVPELAMLENALSGLSRPPPDRLRLCCTTDTVGLAEQCDLATKPPNPLNALLIVGSGVALPKTPDTASR